MKSVSRSILLMFMLLLGICFRLSGADAPAEWQTLASAKKSIGNIRFQIKGDEPLELRVTQKAGGRAVVIRLGKDGISASEVLEGGAQSPVPVRSVYPLVQGGDTHEITLKIRENDWSVYVDGRLRGVFAARFVLPGEIALHSSQAARLAGKAKFVNAARASYITNFMIEPGAPNELYPWNIQTGNWHLHTALQQAVARPETDQQRTKAAPLTADKSPNFYSLKGGGKNTDCIITTGHEIYDNYSMTCSIQPVGGEVGIIVHHRDQAVPEGEKPDPAKAEFYALTLLMNPAGTPDGEIRLWQRKDGARRMLQRARVSLYKNQWYLPGIAVHGDEIICFLDNSELFRIHEPLTPGGKFGMFANTPEEVRLDDVTVSPFADIKLDTAENLRFNCLATEGTVTWGGKALNDASGQGRLTLGDGNARAAVIIGREHHADMVFSVSAAPAGNAWKMGLLAGWNAASGERLEYTVEHKPDNAGETYTLTRIKTDGSAETLASSELSMPWNGKAPEAGDCSLMLDATEPGILRCLKNGRLTLFAEIPKPFTGAFGIWTAPGTTATCSNLNLDLKRNVFKELPQKNPVFQQDSFMRHWASPEGQWIAGKANALWHKGDFFGDYTLKLPCISKGELSVAVPDDKDTGPVVITVNGNEIIMTVHEWLLDGAKPAELKATLTPPKDKAADTLDYTLHHEGQWLWLTVDGKILFSHCLATSLRRYGTRARVRGITVPQLARSKVTRANVIDEFFNESPFMWLANGGDWQIINRFQCTPSWSHMIDEAYNSLGAFWRKQIFTGDMTLEFYAGSRQGSSYDLIGNYNCTIMAQDTTASSGYTATCAEWDQNESQNWSRLYKNGQKLTEVNTYLSPRVRYGNWRKITNPLISRGRDVHGAWYYIKLRKIGGKLEYYFDDELVYTRQDNQPIQEGLVGIWTFLQSMTLAQIKITYDGVRPRPVPVTLLPMDAPEPQPAPKPRQRLAATVNGWPLETMASENWTTDDSVGQSGLHEFNTASGTALLYKNHLGAGNMTLTSKMPPMPSHDIAGWFFKIKRSEAARFNLFYEIHYKSKDNKQGPRFRLFQHISGTDFSLGSWKKTGHTDVPPAKTVTSTDDGWTETTVWLPSQFILTDNDNHSFTLRFGGFGSEQMDGIRNGLQGNVPGSAYAVAALAPVRFDAPLITLGEGETFQAFTDMEGKNPIKAAGIPELLAQLKASQKTGLNRIRLDVAKGDRKVTQPVCWLVENPEPDIQLSWDKAIPDAIRLTNKDSFPDRRFRFTPKILTCNGIAPELLSDMLDNWKDEQDSIVIRFPRSDKITATDGKLTVILNCAATQKTMTLALDDEARANAGPVLLKLNGFTPFFCSFENGMEAPLQDLRQSERQSLLAYGKPDGSAFLHVANLARGQRLKVPFTTNFSAANFPIAQFQYAASDMANVSLQFKYGNDETVKLTEQDKQGAHPARMGHMLKQDEAWHAWTGIVTDSFRMASFNPERFIGSTAIIASVQNHDRTGRYSWLNLDNFVFGPVVNNPEPLAFTPAFHDLDGVQSVRYAVVAGETSIYDMDENARKALKWTELKPGQTIKPSLDGLKDGVHHLAVTAVDAKGVAAAPVDLPFILDRQPLTMKHWQDATKHPQANGLLTVIRANNHALAPLCLNKATFKLHKDDKPARLESWLSEYIHRNNYDELRLNTPFLFREQLNKAKDGDVLELIMDNIVDGAGNPTPALTVPFKVDYAKDKTAPSWYWMAMPASYDTFRNWDGQQVHDTFFTPAEHNGISVSNSLGSSPFLATHTHYSNGAISRALKWNVATHPCLAFRLCQNVIRDKAHLEVVLTTADKATYVISLDAPSKSKGQLNQTTTFQWKANTWYRFAFDVQKMMKDCGVPQEKLKSMTVTSIAFRRYKYNHADYLYLDDFFIFGLPQNPAEPDVLKYTAYDASGIAALQMTCVDDADKELFTHSFANCHDVNLNEIRPKFEGIRWFRTQVKDKAGNLSVPCWIPLLAPDKPAPAPAPAAPAPAAPAPAAPAPAAPAPAAPAPAAPAPAAK